jgi:hypothetical protein
MHTDTLLIALANATTPRRQMLSLTARSAALAGVALAGRNTAIAHADDDEALVGSWMVAATPAGAQAGPPRLLASFTNGGVAVRTAPLQQAAPSALGSDKMVISTTHGAWVRNGDSTFGLTFVGFAFDDTGKFLAMQRIRAGIQLNESQDGFTGAYKADFIGADGQLLVSISGTYQGVRIQVEAPA